MSAHTLKPYRTLNRKNRINPTNVKPQDPDKSTSSQPLDTEIPSTLGDRIRGTFGDIDPLNRVPFEGAISRVKKDPP